MGYYRGIRSPAEVQYQNGKRYDFELLKQTYERIKPIQGQRKQFDIRPIGERNRHWERVYKVSDTEYVLTNMGRWSSNQQNYRSMTFCLNNGMETITIHTPYWVLQDGTKQLENRPLASSSDYYFYAYNLPNGLEMVNHRGRKYVKCGENYYTIMDGDITFQRKQGTKEWQPLVVHREVVHHIDRAKKKAVAGRIKPLIDYLHIMVDMVDEEYHWGAKLLSDEVFKHLDNYNGEPHENWVMIAEKYKHAIKEVQYDKQYRTTITFNKDKLESVVLKDAVMASKPFKQIEVPLGQLCYDRYRSWVK